MKLKSTRLLKELNEVLKSSVGKKSEEVYWVFDEVTETPWENMTVIAPGLYNGEFPKTYGHYHTTTNVPETYKYAYGKGLFMLQKKHVDENGVWHPEMVDEVFIVQPEEHDEEITVTAEYAHAWINVGSLPLVTFDDWTHGHKSSDYEPIKKLQGLAYYVVLENGQISLEPNPNYKTHPNPQWITAKEYLKLKSKGSVSSIS